MYQLANEDEPFYIGSEFQCNDCKRIFKLPRNLQNHKCSYCRRCRRIFSTYQRFHNHKNTVCRYDYELEDMVKNSTSNSSDKFNIGSKRPFPAELTEDSTSNSSGNCDKRSKRLIPVTEFNPGDIIYVKEEEVEVQDEEIIGVNEGEGDEEFILADKNDIVNEEAESGEANAVDSSQRNNIGPSSKLWQRLTGEANITASSTRGKVIECKAAVAWEPCKPLVIETVKISPPKPKEVRIKIAYSGLCHCDVNALQGKIPKPRFPIILGHEGSGIVESVGEGVTSVKEGDHVVTFPVMRCEECTQCKAKDNNLCQGFFKSPEVAGLMADGSSRLTCKDQTIYNHLTNSTFSQYAVVEESQVIKVSKTAPLDKLCLLGCGVPTGFGAAVNTAKVKPGSTCAIFGLGTVGLSAVMGCKHRGAARIIGIDENNAKNEIGKKFGMTEFYNPNDFDKPIKEVLVERTQGGCDYTFECIGNTRVMESALESCHAGNSRCILVRGVPPGEKINIDPYQVILGRLIGSILGGYLAKDVPKLEELYLEKELLLDKLITSISSLEEINEAFESMGKEEAIKHVIKL